MENEESHGGGATVEDALRNQVALVTGGGRGFGRVAAEALATAGAAVAILGRSTAALEDTVAGIRRAGGRALACASDVTDRVAVEAAVGLTEQELGPIDLLVNNAALITPVGPPWEVDPDEWWRTLEVNLRGPFLCARAVLPGMSQRGRGRIVNVVSGAVQGAHPNASAYAVSKVALTHLTRSLAAGTEGTGIAIFALNPGTMTTQTGMQQFLSTDDEAFRYYPTFRQVAAEGRGIPPERSAGLVVSLATGVADALSGRLVSVHDDLDAVISRVEEIREGNLRVLRIATEPVTP